MVNPFMGLGNFGLTQPSVSSKVDEASAPESDMLSKMLGGPSQILDDTAKSNLLQQLLAQTEGADVPSTMDRILSPQGLIALLGTGAAGALGGAEGAAGFGIGALGGAQAATQAELALKRKAVDELTERNEKVLDRLDKSHNRIATLFNTNPEAFVDPITGKQTVSPDVLGFYATGEALPLSATTRRAMDRFDTATAKRHEILSETLKKTTDPADRKVILDAVFGNLSHFQFDPPAELTTTLANATPESWDNDIVNTYLKYGGASGLQAIIFARENKLPWDDPRVLSMVHYTDPDASANKRTPSDRFLELVSEVNAWSTDPANKDRYTEILRENAKKGDGATSLAVAKEVLGDRRGDFDIYADEAELRGIDEMAQTVAQYKVLLDQYKLGVGLSGIDQTEFIRGMTPQEQQGWLWDQAGKNVDAQKQTDQDNAARQSAAQANGVAKRLQAELGAAPADAQAHTKAIARIALTRATRPDGTVDRTRYEQELRAVTDEVIKKAKAGE